MNISPKQIKYRKKVGSTSEDSKDIYEIGLIGGLHLIVKADGSKSEIMGAGPHRAVARHIAQQKEKIDFNDLRKSEEVSVQIFADVLPEYEDLTDRMRGA